MSRFLAEWCFHRYRDGCCVCMSISIIFVLFFSLVACRSALIIFILVRIFVAWQIVIIPFAFSTLSLTMAIRGDHPALQGQVVYGDSSGLPGFTYSGALPPQVGGAAAVVGPSAEKKKKRKKIEHEYRERFNLI